MEKRNIKALVNEELILVYVKEIRKNQPRIGTRKLYIKLEKAFARNEIKIGRDKFFDILRRNNLLVRRKRRFVHTTDSQHAYKKYPNLKKGFVANRPEQIWVSDITYLNTKCGFSYLSLVTDECSKEIVGYNLSETLHAKGPILALKRALRKHQTPGSKLIHHSDRGIQYCCNEYINLLKSNSIMISMSNKGNPYENAVAERVNGILKTEFNLDRVFENHIQLRRIVNKTIHIYNTERPHLSCDYMTPSEAHKQKQPLRKRWKHYPRSKNTNKVKSIDREAKAIQKQLTKV